MDALDQLDLKLWVALSCPTRGIEFDTRTLDLIDTDRDGRIRAPEIIAAAKWACQCLKNPDDLLNGSPSFPLNAINNTTPEGKQLFASARHILANIGKPDAGAIAVEDTMDTARIFSQTNFNGDGIVPMDAAPDDTGKALISDVITCLGAETDRSGKPGSSRRRRLTPTDGRKLRPIRVSRRWGKRPRPPWQLSKRFDSRWKTTLPGAVWQHSIIARRQPGLPVFRARPIAIFQICK